MVAMQPTLRILGLVLVTCAGIALADIFANMASAAAFHVTPGGDPPMGYLLSDLLAGFVAAGLGGYVCVRFAPLGRATITVAALLVVFVVFNVVVGRASATAGQPRWYVALAAMLGAIGLLIGAASRLAAGKTMRSGD